MFRLCDSNMYTHMAKGDCDAVVERGVALHKMIRMITMTAGGEGYLNFMGNEFGHPEWIDFPREGNGWSHFYCRRQWHLADDENLKYTYLSEFDRALVSLARSSRLLCEKEKSLYIDNEAKVLVYERGDYTFAFNFSPTQSYPSYPMRVSRKGKYRVELSSDEGSFGGYDRISKEYVYSAGVGDDGVPFFEIYLPARTALCVRRTRTTRSKKAAKKEK
jgi:1,4-alpha-glucan branching enzyme